MCRIKLPCNSQLLIFFWYGLSVLQNQWRRTKLRQVHPTCMTVLSDGRFAFGQQSGVIRLWDDNTRPQYLKNHGYFCCMSSLPDGQIALGMVDGTISLLKNDVIYRSLLDCHVLTVTCLATMPNWQLASGSRDKTIRLWNIDPNATSRCAALCSGHTDVCVV